MSRIFGFMVTRDEADRYLDGSLKWHSFLDDIFVYDDRSSDRTRDIAREAGAVVVERPEDVPSFLEHEGNFRQAAWKAFCRHLQPMEGDWVLALDADEFFVDTMEGAELEQLLLLSVNAELRRCNAVDLKVIEIFGQVNGVPQQRVDGFWDTITSPRFFAWSAGITYRPVAMGCGAGPQGLKAMDGTDQPCGLLHYGYMRPQDRLVKYERYIDRPGHSTDHVRSIITTPELIPWKGVAPSD